MFLRYLMLEPCCPVVTYICHGAGVGIAVKVKCGAFTSRIHANTATLYNAGYPMMFCLLYAVPVGPINIYISIELALHSKSNITCTFCL